MRTKKNAVVILAAVMVSMLAGCAAIATVALLERTRTVDYYMENNTERKEKLKECEANPGELGYSANCVNARQAEENVTGKRKKVAPNPLIAEHEKRQQKKTEGAK